MNAAEIRSMGKLNQDLIQDARKVEHQPIIALSGIAMFLCEIAAQFAEANEHLAKMMVCDVSDWVWLKSNGKDFVVDRRDVTGVAPLDIGIGNDSPKVCIGMKGQPWSKSADGTVREVCAKLGIPLEG